METIAITNWNGIVSPLYDASCCFMIVRQNELSKLIDVSSMTLFDKANLCAKEGVSVLICGAISKNGLLALSKKSIKVVPWIRGDINEIIRVYRNSASLPVRFFMPGCRRGNCRIRNFGLTIIDKSQVT